MRTAKKKNFLRRPYISHRTSRSSDYVSSLIQDHRSLLFVFLLFHHRALPPGWDRKEEKKEETETSSYSSRLVHFTRFRAVAKRETDVMVTGLEKKGGGDRETPGAVPRSVSRHRAMERERER